MRVETRLRIVNELHVAQRALTSIANSRLQRHRIHGFSAQSSIENRVESRRACRNGQPDVFRLMVGVDFRLEIQWTFIKSMTVTWLFRACVAKGWLVSPGYKDALVE